jgi:hypothetical protein
MVPTWPAAGSLKLTTARRPGDCFLSSFKAMAMMRETDVL